MKAAIRTVYGSPDVLKVIPYNKPKPKANELLIRVHATTVNRTDCAILRGKPYLMRLFTGLLKPSSNIPGTDFAGKIEAIGKSVTHFKIGDKVWGFYDEGLASQAEYMTIKFNKSITKIPQNISYSEAVACGEGAHYAYNFINKVTITKNTKVLINGATGGIGTAALQLLKHSGAYVTAIGNTPNLDLLKSLGADKVIDYLTTDFTKDTEKYHFVLDTVGKSTFHQCKHLLFEKGAYISSELGPNAQNLYLPIYTKLFTNKRVIFPFPSNCKRSVLFLTELMEKNIFKAVIDRKYEVDQIREAYTYVEKGEKTGNVIITY